MLSRWSASAEQGHIDRLAVEFAIEEYGLISDEWWEVELKMAQAKTCYEDIEKEQSGDDKDMYWNAYDDMAQWWHDGM